MKTPIITTKDVLRGEETETVPATFSQKALKQLREYHQQGLKNKAWDLPEPEFIAWMAAVGVVGCTQGNKKDNEKDKKIKELQAELNTLRKAQK